VAEPTRIRAVLAGDKATVRMLLSHEMESGQRKDASGKLVPTWHVQTVSVPHNGRAVLSVHCGPAVSKNPFFQFSLRGARPGDRISVQWLDNRGTRRSDEATIA